MVQETSYGCAAISSPQSGSTVSCGPQQSTQEEIRAVVGRKDTRKRKRLSRDGLFKKNGWWWIDYYDADGKRHRNKAALKYETAKLIYREIRQAIAKGLILGVREEGIRIRDFVEQRYWPTVKAGLSHYERLRARTILDKQILPCFGGVKLSKLGREDIESWQATRLAGVSGSTANKELMRLKHLLNRAVAWGYLKETPARWVKKAKEAPGRVRYLTPEERNMLLNGHDVTITARDGRTWTTRQKPSASLRLYILAALQTGARRSELLDVRWSDIDINARTVTFRHTKNGDRRVVPMTEVLENTIISLPRSSDPEAPVLPKCDPQVLTRSFARLVQRLGIKNLRFHDLRHDVASTLTIAGVPQRAVMEILGHRDPRITARYQHLAPGHLRDAMRSLSAALPNQSPA